MRCFNMHGILSLTCLKWVLHSPELLNDFTRYQIEKDLDNTHFLCQKPFPAKWQNDIIDVNVCTLWGILPIEYEVFQDKYNHQL